MTDKSTVEQKESLVNLIEDLLDVNFKILTIIDERLTDLEDHIDLECSKEREIEG